MSFFWLRTFIWPSKRPPRSFMLSSYNKKFHEISSKWASIFAFLPLVLKRLNFAAKACDYIDRFLDSMPIETRSNIYRTIFGWYHTILSGIYSNCLAFRAGFIFHRFLDITNKWIWQILEFRKKSSSLG